MPTENPVLSVIEHGMITITGDMLTQYIARKFLLERLEAMYVERVVPVLGESFASRKITRPEVEETDDHRISFYLLILSLGPAIRASMRAHRYSLAGKDGRGWCEMDPYIQRSMQLLARIVMSSFVL